jgi:lactoylglutathione lyase
MPQLNFVVLVVSDVARATAFYSDVFEAGAPKKDVAGSYAQLDVGAVSLALVTADFASSALPEVPLSPVAPSQYSCFISFLTEDLPSLLEKVTSSGGEILHPPKRVPWGGSVAFIRDPDGNLIELFQKDSCAP